MREESQLNYGETSSSSSESRCLCFFIHNMYGGWWNESHEACMATRFDGGDILWWLWGPREPQEEREERLLFALLPLYLPTLPSLSSLSSSTSGTLNIINSWSHIIDVCSILATLFSSHNFGSCWWFQLSSWWVSGNFAFGFFYCVLFCVQFKVLLQFHCRILFPSATGWIHVQLCNFGSIFVVLFCLGRKRSPGFCLSLSTCTIWVNFH